MLFRVAVLVAAALGLASPALGKVLTVCGGVPESLAASRADLPATRPYAAFAFAAPDTLVRPARIALTADETGYDIRLNWGEQNEQSLRSAGAEILSAGPDESLVHLMVARTQLSPVEHYLFQLDAAGKGELLSGQDTDDLRNGLARFSCTKP
jgi:hypothetical protein